VDEKRCSQSSRKFLQFACRLLYCVGTGLPTASSGPPGRAERKGKCEECKRTAYYARRLLAANAVNKTNKYQITADTIKEDKTICNTLGPPSPIPVFHVPVSRTGFLFPLDGSVQWRVALCSAVGGIDRTASSNSALINRVRLLCS